MSCIVEYLGTGRGTMLAGSVVSTSVTAANLLLALERPPLGRPLIQ